MKIKQILNYIILFVSFILIFGLVLACSEVSTKPEKVEELTEEDTKTDKALAEFLDTYNITFRESVEKHDALNREFSENVRKLNAIDDDKKDLDPKMEPSLLKRKLSKLSQNALDILEEMQEMLEKQKDNINDQSNVISKIQGNVVKIRDPSKKLLAQEIADKQRKFNNLMFELTELYEKETEYFYSYWEDAKAISLDKLTFKIALERKEERDEKIEENEEEIEELSKAIRTLAVETSDLKAKLDSLEP